MNITENCVLSCHTPLTKNCLECFLNKIETEINEIFEAFSSNFWPLVKFINEENAEFETLLNKAEEGEQRLKSLPQRKIGYNLRYRPYRSFQNSPNPLIECKKQKILNLFYSGIAKTAIEKEYNIHPLTLREWCKLSSSPDWNQYKLRG